MPVQPVHGRRPHDAQAVRDDCLKVREEQYRTGKLTLNVE